jgi:uncharacterized protein
MTVEEWMATKAGGPGCEVRPMGWRCAATGAVLLTLFLGLLPACEPVDRSRVLAVATAGTGGVYYILGGSMADLWTRRLPEHEAVAEVTGGSVENLSLLLEGEVEVAFSMGTNARHAYDAVGPFRGRPPGELRALVALYPNLLHVVTTEGTGIRNLDDLRGRRVSVGAPGSGTEVAARTLLEANGIGYEDLRPQRLNFNETANALRDGAVDAGFWSVGIPTSSIVDLATARSIFLVPISRDQVARTAEADPTVRPDLIPRGTYTGQSDDVSTLSTPNVLVVRADLPGDLAYALLSVLLESREELAAVHPSAAHISAEYTLEAVPIPLHPGAVRYLEETGHPVPQHLVADP